MLLWLFSIRRFFKIWSNILNYSTPTESIRTNTAAEGVETFVVWAMTSLRRKASFAHQPMQALSKSIRRTRTAERGKKKKCESLQSAEDSGAEIEENIIVSVHQKEEQGHAEEINTSNQRQEHFYTEIA